MSQQVFSLSDDYQTGLASAQAALAAGGLVVFPTDTVYGIAADAFQSGAVANLLAAKQRGRDMPVPVLVADVTVLHALASEIPAGALALANNLWPGALTLILRAQSSLALDLGDADGTIAVRVPDHEAARDLLRRSGPLAVSSANVSGLAPATTCADAERMLGHSVVVYLDGGATPGNVPSTIIDFTSTSDGLILRQGALGFAELQQCCSSLQVIDSSR